LYKLTITIVETYYDSYSTAGTIALPPFLRQAHKIGQYLLCVGWDGLQHHANAWRWCPRDSSAIATTMLFWYIRSIGDLRNVLKTKTTLVYYSGIVIYASIYYVGVVIY